MPGFLERTRADILAVTVGNVHGRYAKPNPRLDFGRLSRVKIAAGGASYSPLLSSTAGTSSGPGTLLAIHGASGLPASQVQKSISLGVCKFNVNTEVRTAAVNSFLAAGGALAPGSGNANVDLLGLLDGSVEEMSTVIQTKMLEFDPLET